MHPVTIENRVSWRVVCGSLLDLIKFEVLTANIYVNISTYQMSYSTIEKTNERERQQIRRCFKSCTVYDSRFKVIKLAYGGSTHSPFDNRNYWVRFFTLWEQTGCIRLEAYE